MIQFVVDFPNLLIQITSMSKKTKPITYRPQQSMKVPPTPSAVMESASAVAEMAQSFSVVQYLENM